jgi:hypothetical protein
MVTMKGHGHYATHLITFFIFIFFTQTIAFMPTDFKENWFGNGGTSHQAQTRQAYDQLVQKYFPGIRTSTTMENARKDLEMANIAVDEDQTTSAKHFDGESFDGGQARLVQLKLNVSDAIVANDGDKARAALGGALHTLQDFYAHTNWIEMGNINNINPNLGKAGVSITYAAFEEATCTLCGFYESFLGFFKGCHDCSHNTDVATKLTSGYYFGEDSPGKDASGNKIEIPSNKCHHGK